MRSLPDLVVDIGLKVEHYQEIFEQKPDIGFFEILSESFMIEGGLPLKNLEKILALYPVVQHGFLYLLLRQNSWTLII